MTTLPSTITIDGQSYVLEDLLAQAHPSLTAGMLYYRLIQQRWNLAHALQTPYVPRGNAWRHHAAQEVAAPRAAATNRTSATGDTFPGPGPSPG